MFLSFSQWVENNCFPFLVKKKLVNSNLDEAFLKIFIAGQLEGYKSKTKETKRKTHGHVNYKPAIKLTSNSYFLLDNHFL